MSRSRIVVIEDSSDEQMFITRAILKMASPPDVTMMNSAEEAIAHFNNTTRIPDLVLVDVSLPRMSGIEMIKELKKLPHCSQAPFVCFSTSDLQSDVSTAYAAGAFGYVVKNTDMLTYSNDVRDIVHYWTKLNVTTRFRFVS